MAGCKGTGRLKEGVASGRSCQKCFVIIIPCHVTERERVCVGGGEVGGGGEQMEGSDICNQ